MKKNNNEIIWNGAAAPVFGMEGVKPYNFKEIDDDTVEVDMYGQIIESRPFDYWTGKPEEGLYIVLEDFLKDLDVYKEKSNITFRINSVGGDLYAGISICNRISELKGNTVTIVDGLAASAASIILQGGKTRKAFAGSQVMVHGASAFLFGSYNLKDLKQLQKRIEGGNNSALETYAARTGKDKDYIKNIMEHEEWMTGQEAIDKGFVDELIKTEKSVNLLLSEDRKFIMANGITMSLEGFKNIPRDIPVMGVMSGNTPEVIYNNSKTGGEEKMDLDELKLKYPELVQQIVDETRALQKGNETALINEAVEKERKRIQEIEQIENQIADKLLISNAKYSNPITAQELAFESMKQQRATGQEFLRNMEKDFLDSGVGEIGSSPNAGRKTEEEEKLEDVIEGAKLIVGMAK